MRVGDSSWTDYYVEFEADASSCWFYGAGNVIGVRVLDLDNMIALRWVDCESTWYVIRDGEWNEVPHQTKDGLGYGLLRLRMTVEGNKFMAHVGDNRIFSFRDDTFLQGGIALRLDKNTVIDNFVVRPVTE